MSNHDALGVGQALDPVWVLLVEPDEKVPITLVQGVLERLDDCLRAFRLNALRGVGLGWCLGRIVDVPQRDTQHGVALDLDGLSGDLRTGLVVALDQPARLAVPRQLEAGPVETIVRTDPDRR